jgi:ketosteroid isomerase-like protein
VTIDESLPTASPAAAAEDERELRARYVQAFANDDVDGLVAILRDDAFLRVPPQPDVIGGDAIAAIETFLDPALAARSEGAALRESEC